MKCPVCGTWTNVLDSRNGRRKRECANLHRFITQENVVTIGPLSSTNKTAKCIKTPSLGNASRT